MAEEKEPTTQPIVSEPNNVENDSNHYIEAIREMKANTVDKEAYRKLQDFLYLEEKEGKELVFKIIGGHKPYQEINYPGNAEKNDYRQTESFQCVF